MRRMMRRFHAPWRSILSDICAANKEDDRLNDDSIVLIRIELRSDDISEICEHSFFVSDADSVRCLSADMRASEIIREAFASAFDIAITASVFSFSTRVESRDS